VTTLARPRRAAFALVAAVYAAVMLGGTIPIPLWDVWASRLGFGPFLVTLAFGLYAVGTMVSLTLLSGWSDHVGRRPALLAGLVLSALSAVLLLAAPHVLVVLFARLVGGIGAGVTAATASAALAELALPGHAQRASVVATASNVGGLGAGVLVAAAAIQLGGPDNASVALVYTAYLVVVVALAVGLLVVPETVSPRRAGGVAFRRPLLPAGRAPSRAFGWAAAGVFVAFAVTGLFSSLVPSLLQDQLAIRTPIVPGLVVALLFAAALAAQTLAPPALVERPWAAAGALALGTGVYETGLLVANLGVFVAGTVLAGAGFGLTFRRGMGIAQHVAEHGRRADQLATWFLCAYAGNIVPTLALGAAGQVWGARVASAALAVAIVLSAIATGVGAGPTRRSS
jgi:MFS family permease